MPGRSSSSRNNNIVVLGRVRAGKTSIIRTLVNHLDPKDAVGLDPTDSSSSYHLDSFIPLVLWDTPGQTKPDRAPKHLAHVADPTQLAWEDVCALIYVIDAQDHVYHTDLSFTIADAYEHNPNISFHIFVHKIDGHSDDYSSEVLQGVEEGVDDQLRYELDTYPDVKRHYHMTSIYDSSIFVAFSRVLRQLLTANTFAEQLDVLCDKFNTTCSMERTYIFDIPNRIYLATDNSPSDSSAFTTMSAYLKFLLQFAGIYSRLQESVTTDGAPDIGTAHSAGARRLSHAASAAPGRYASSTARLTKDISLAFWQLNNSLALVTMLRTNTYATQAGLLEYNIAFFRRGVNNLYELAQQQGPVLSVVEMSREPAER
ncbi:hypothetical protein V8E36_005823 [Tilletia maclaganii]